MRQRKSLFLLVAVSLFLGATSLLLGMVRLAHFLPVHTVRAQDVQAQAVTVGSVFTNIISTVSSITVNVSTGTGDNRPLLVGVCSQAFTQSPKREITAGDERVSVRTSPA